MPDYVRRASGSMIINDITPESANWDWSGLVVVDLNAGDSFDVDLSGSEFLVLPLWGSAEVNIAATKFTLKGRQSVFDGPTDFVYVGRDDVALVTAITESRIAFPSSVARHHLPTRYQSADKVAVEMRGAGSCSRQVNNFCTPGEFEADRLIACEVVTPAGNWSSFPPHKHDQSSVHESELEEIYYYEFSQSPERGAGLGFQRVYGTDERPIDVFAEVHSGDVVLIPHGWHGPSIAVPGYDMYYLNVMAGPGQERVWKICDDPAHAWVRDTWTSMRVDPRLPLKSNSPSQ